MAWGAMSLPSCSLPCLPLRVLFAAVIELDPDSTLVCADGIGAQVSYTSTVQTNACPLCECSTHSLPSMCGGGPMLCSKQKRECKAIRCGQRSTRLASTVRCRRRTPSCSLESGLLSSRMMCGRLCVLPAYQNLVGFAPPVARAELPASHASLLFL